MAGALEVCDKGVEDVIAHTVCRNVLIMDVNGQEARTAAQSPEQIGKIVCQVFRAHDVVPLQGPGERRDGP